MRPTTFVVAALFFVLAVGDSAAAASLPLQQLSERNITLGAEQWQLFKSRFNKSYISPAEEELRYGFFLEWLYDIPRLQRLNPLATYRVTALMDLSPAEFKRMHNLDQYRALKGIPPRKPPTEDELRTMKAQHAEYNLQRRLQAPTSWDWRQEGGVTEIKDQGQCGSCWAFSTSVMSESANFMAGNSLISLSPEELVQCDTSDSGCDGGDLDSAMDWLIEGAGGVLATWTGYPYTSGGGRNGHCNPGLITPGATMTARHNAGSYSESTMMGSVYTTGPLAICVDAGDWSPSYGGGLVTNCGHYNTDHCVGLAGYITGNPLWGNYWIIKNSWGTSWGDGGYMYAPIGVNCDNLASEPRYATAKGPGPRPPGPPGPPTPPGPPPTPAGPSVSAITCATNTCNVLCSDPTDMPLGTCMTPCPGDLLGSQMAIHLSGPGGDWIRFIMFRSLTCDPNTFWRNMTYLNGACNSTLDGLGFTSFTLNGI